MYIDPLLYFSFSHAIALSIEYLHQLQKVSDSVMCVIEIFPLIETIYLRYKY